MLRCFYVLGLALLLGLSLSACRSAEPALQTSAFQTAEVIYLGRAEVGTLTVQSVGYGADVGQAVRHAEESAFRALLFRGIPGSTQASAMVRRPAEQRARHARYFDAFFAGGRYATFMTASYLDGDPQRVGDTHRVIVALTINQHALRRDLEAHGVIRGFGL